MSEDELDSRNTPAIILINVQHNGLIGYAWANM